MHQPEIVVLPDSVALAEEAARRFLAVAAAANARRGQFNVALAGGSTPAKLYQLLARAPYRDEIDWARTYVYFGDERCVPPDHPDSNFRMAHTALLDHVPLPTANIFRMAGELPPPDAAEIYEKILRQDFRLRGKRRPHFDLILLGMGDDGHTASLFPDMPALDEKRRLVVPTNVPDYARPAVPRLTLTLPVLSAAEHVLFLVAGASKAATLAAVLTGPEPVDPLPARRVRPETGRLTWLLDEAAAMNLC